MLEYFDAHVVGLTATPGKQTFGFFKQNLVSEYTYPQSVADNVNVDFEIYRIKTQISEQGSTIEAGTVVPKVDRRTRAQRYEALDEDLDYTARQLDRAVTATDQIRIVLKTFRDRLFTEIFPGRSVRGCTPIRTPRGNFGPQCHSAGQMTVPSSGGGSVRMTASSGARRRRQSLHEATPESPPVGRRPVRPG